MIALPNPLEVIELDIEGLYEETFLNTAPLCGELDEFQQREEMQAARESRKIKMMKRPREYTPR